MESGAQAALSEEHKAVYDEAMKIKGEGIKHFNGKDADMDKAE